MLGVSIVVPEILRDGKFVDKSMGGWVGGFVGGEGLN
jgi:hypothetical protein